MKKLSLSLMFLLTLLCLCQSAVAQSQNDKGKDNFFKRTIHGIFNPKVKYDTLYIGRPYGKWAISANESLSRYKVHQITDAARVAIISDLCMTTGLSLAYKGIGLGYSVNFAKINGKNKDKNITFNMYGNSFGIDFRLFNVKGLHTADKGYEMLDKGYYKGLNINAYYVFNNKKFSYPAAFSYSQVQKRNAGSVIAGLSYYNDDLWLGNDEEEYNRLFGELSEIMPDTITVLSAMPSEWKTQYISIGAGYAYNWVPGRHWLIHASIEPSLLLWQKAEVITNDVTIDKKPDSGMQVTVERNCAKAKYKFFNFGCNGRFGATYLWKRGYVGAYYVGTMNYIGFPGIDVLFYDNYKVINYWWNTKFTVGFRF